MTDHDHLPEPGRIRPPYSGRTTCTAGDCLSGRPFNEDDGVYVHHDLETGKLLMLCGPCSQYVELHAPHRFPLLPL